MSRSIESSEQSPEESSARSSAADLLIEARRALSRGNLDAGEESVHRALQAATREGDHVAEVKAAVLLGELLVTQRSPDQALDLLRHATQRGRELPRATRDRVAADLATAQRYLDELEPIDPRFVEWAD